MKHFLKYLFLIATFTIVQSSFAQQPKEKLNCPIEYDSLHGMDVYWIVDRMPIPEDGNMNDVLKGIGKCLSVPSESELRTHGKPLISFVVDENGVVISVRIKQGNVSKDSEERVYEFLKTIYWKPGKCKSKYVPVRMDLVFSCIKLG
ncbi:hypothetical protein V6R21_15090 [Limibacter armeniacum]|uniref:energy transducer TonB n=1 Tax=Limibacter armeniacum TaxID=466084 RepID=UPI002FE5D4D1